MSQKTITNRQLTALLSLAVIAKLPTMPYDAWLLRNIGYPESGDVTGTAQYVHYGTWNELMTQWYWSSSTSSAGNCFTPDCLEGRPFVMTIAYDNTGYVNIDVVIFDEMKYAQSYKARTQTLFNEGRSWLDAACELYIPKYENHALFEVATAVDRRGRSVEGPIALL